jgi:hypothetical protein
LSVINLVSQPLHRIANPERLKLDYGQTCVQLSLRSDLIADTFEILQPPLLAFRIAGE